jgi:hypothetical protein
MLELTEIAENAKITLTTPSNSMECSLQAFKGYMIGPWVCSMRESDRRAQVRNSIGV